MSKKVTIPDEVVIEKIFMIRENKVMVDRDLAELYGVETRALNQAVRRNLKRFPEDFMFQMTDEEMEDWKSQIVISNKEKMGIRKNPLVFTEQGVTMLSCVLSSDRAIQVNIQIIRIFTRMREMLLTHKDMLLKMEKMEKEVAGQNEKIQVIFNYLKQFIKEQQTPRKKIGFKQQGEK